MNATKTGLYEGTEFMDDEEHSEGAIKDAGILASQSAEIALMCALALDSAAYEDCDSDHALDVAKIASRLMFKCYDDLTVAVGIMS